MNRKLGQFEIGRHMLEDSPEDVQRIMGECIIVRAEMMYSKEAIEYVAMSKHFDEVPAGCVAKWYTPHVVEGIAIFLREK